MKKTITFLLPFFCALCLSAQTKITLLPFGADWKYLDNGNDPGTLWNQISFNDDRWKTGKAELGYGNGDEVTVVSYGPDANNKYPTTYFRKTLTVSDISKFSSFKLSLKRDDGAIVYINGESILHTNMPSKNITYKTTALEEAPEDGNQLKTKILDASVLKSGANIIAVEIHQVSPSSSDLSFDLKLEGTMENEAPSFKLTRGPYLQMGSETAVTLRWRTDKATSSKIEVGTTLGTYPLSASDPTLTKEHEIRITGLSPDTKYYYRFGSSSQVVQGDSANYFITAPKENTKRKIRVAVFGDAGTNAYGFQSGSLKSYLKFYGSNPGELMLLLGDNAYNDGTDEQYQKKFFDGYNNTILKNHIMFPAPGNHDYHTTSQSERTAPYYKIFTMPTAGESGGVPSGTKAYYSFNWGNIHFISLDSYGTEKGKMRLYDTLSPQAEWLKKDLAANANTRKWIVVFFHHPPYSMGSKDSDKSKELINMRKNIIPILERYGIDLVLSGHSHNYERSYLLNEYYGMEASFDPQVHAVSTSTAKYNGSKNSCPYITKTGQPGKGIVYVVSGSAGADGIVQPSYPHNAMPFAIDDGGMFYFEVEDNRLDAKFIRRDSTIADQFTIYRDVARITNMTVQAGSSIKLNCSWQRDHVWTTGETTRGITVSPTQNTTYRVTDRKNCITDVFNVTVVNPANPAITSIQAREENEAAAHLFRIIPTVVKRGQNITVQANAKGMSEVIIVDNSGRQVQSIKFTGTTTIATGSLIAGTYYVRINRNNKLPVQKFIVTD